MQPVQKSFFRFLFLVVLFSGAFTACRQDLKLSHTNTVFNKADSLNQLADKWEKSNIDSAFFYVQKAKETAEKWADTSGLIKSLNNLGFAL